MVSLRSAVMSGVRNIAPRYLQTAAKVALCSNGLSFGSSGTSKIRRVGRSCDEKN